jgi:hypothetical protein
MSRNVELPDDVYTRIEAEASATGSTVAEWIEAVAPKPCAAPRAPGIESSPAVLTGNGSGRAPETAGGSAPSQRTMADRLAGRLGTIASGGIDAIAARPGDAFSDYLIEKKRNGRL